MKRRKIDYDGIIKSTKTYYDEYSERYVEFYENWLKSKGVFSDSHYREGYETVAKFLRYRKFCGEGH